MLTWAAACPWPRETANASPEEAAWEQHVFDQKERTKKDVVIRNLGWLNWLRMVKIQMKFMYSEKVTSRYLSNICQIAINS